MRIFVAGATGAIGRPLLDQLLARGHDVVALTRSQERAQLLVAQGIHLRAQMYSTQIQSKQRSPQLLNNCIKI
jgi:uncharacterized protein YbjT (DUF2867 family)